MDSIKTVEQAYLKFKNPIYNFILRLASDHELAMDVTQQTFLNVLSDNSQLNLTKSGFIVVARNIFLYRNES